MASGRGEGLSTNYGFRFNNRLYRWIFTGGRHRSGYGRQQQLIYFQGNPWKVIFYSS